MKSKPVIDPVSLIMTTYNAERTLKALLDSIEQQDFPKNKLEVIIVDGKSTDKTLEIARNSKLPIKIIESPYPKDPEASRVIGIKMAMHDLFCIVDADNYFQHKSWLSNMVKPLTKHKEVYGAYAWRYLYNKKEIALNRYFALLGAADPVGFYLKKDDRISYLYDKWNLKGKILEDYKDYFIIAYDTAYFPTLGANATFFRRNMLFKHIKITPENFFHIDTAYDMAKKGFNKYILVRQGIGHNATDSAVSFLKRRARYMGIHYLARSGNRRYKVFDPTHAEDVRNLIKFVFFSLTFIEPTIFALRGYMKIRDRAWFIHPVFCFVICIMYSYSVTKGVIDGKISKK